MTHVRADGASCVEPLRRLSFAAAATSCARRGVIVESTTAVRGAAGASLAQLVTHVRAYGASCGRASAAAEGCRRRHLLHASQRNRGEHHRRS